MTEESPTTSHLSVAMTTMEMTQTTDDSGTTVVLSDNSKLYFRSVVLFLGVIGTAANGLILYALVASKQHKKHVLIVNQNCFDLFSSVFLIITYAMKIANIRLTGALGYWVCMIILSEKLIWLGIIGSVINLAIITIERYLKVVHSAWSKRNLHRWIIYLAMAFAWIASIIYNVAIVFPTSSVTDGACNTYAIWESEMTKVILFIWKFVSFYVIILLICIFCYTRILVVVRRQAKVMASHGPGASTSAQAQKNKMQSSVIKTMILISAFYAISWLPTYIYLLLLNLNPTLPIVKIGYYVAEFISWMYICTNPFIYAVKFEPVKRVLFGMIPCKCLKPAIEDTTSVGTSFRTAPSVPQRDVNTKYFNASTGEQRQQ